MRLPVGSGWYASASAPSKSAWMLSASITPVCRHAARNAAWTPASAPVCDAVAAWPPAVRPDLSASTGLAAAAPRSASTKAGPPLTSSRYSVMTLLAVSAARNGITSVSLTSASLPTLRKRLNPTPRPMLQSMMPPHSAPDCDRKAMLPAGGIPLTKVVFSGVCVSITPMPFGPMIRMPKRWAISIISRSRAAPSGPTSRKPPEMTTAALIPRLPHASTAADTIPAGRISTASSTGSGAALMSG